MNRTFKAAAAAVLLAGAGGSVGCHGTGTACGAGGGCGADGGHGGATCQDRLAGLWDPCWPERYSYQARQATLQPFAAHANNGAIVDQTLSNYHFEEGKDTLLPGGIEKLDYLARKRPAPDKMIYLQTARDLKFDAAAPDKLASTRQDLDARRAQVVQKYLAGSTAGRPLSFDVQVIDPADIAIPAQGPANAARGWPSRFVSGIGGVTSNNAPAGTGGAVGGVTGGANAGGATAGQTGAGVGSAGGTSGGSAGGTGGGGGGIPR